MRSKNILPFMLFLLGTGIVSGCQQQKAGHASSSPALAGSAQTTLKRSDVIAAMGSGYVTVGYFGPTVVMAYPGKRFVIDSRTDEVLAMETFELPQLTPSITSEEAR
jgi:hypothetical protein